jgi:hypothetical protein
MKNETADPVYRTLILRCWSEQDGAESRRFWRFHLQWLDTQERQSFADVAALLASLNQTFGQDDTQDLSSPERLNGYKWRKQIMTKRRMFIYYSLALIGAMLTLLSGCEKKEALDPPVSTEDVSNYLQGLPSWSQFAPPGQAQPPTPAGEAQTGEDVVLDVELFNEDGSLGLLENVTYSCQVQPFTLTDNPQQIAMYSPDREILYAGGLIQGKSHRDGLGSLLGLPIAERAPINVSIPGLANDDNFRRVDRPTRPRSTRPSAR